MCKDIQIFYPEINYRKDISRKEIIEIYNVSNCGISQAIYRKNRVKNIGGYIIPSDTPKKETNKIYKNLVIGGEIWKRYKDTNYMISNMGRCKNIERDTIIMPYNSNKTDGYGGRLRFRVIINGKRESLTVRRVVYELFVGEIPKGMCVIHNNMNYMDCRETNLKLVTNSKVTAISNFYNNSIAVKDEEGNIYDSLTQASEECFMSIERVSSSLKLGIKACGKRFYYV